MKSIRIKNLSIKKKILLGYLLIICIILMVMFLLLGTLWKHLIKESISKSIYSSNYQIKKSIDNYFDSMVKDVYKRQALSYLNPPFIRELRRIFVYRLWRRNPA